MTDRNPKAIANRRMKDRKRRKKLGERLRREGYSEVLIEDIMVRERQKDLIARIGLEKTKEIRGRRGSPDDKGYKPDSGDPLLRGPARAQGITAKVVRRGSTITEYQYDRMVDGDPDDVTPGGSP